jgi:hypothetical protein
MGFLNLLRRANPAIQKLPSGTITVDRSLRVVTSTVASSYPPQLLHAICKHVMSLFLEARKAQLPLSELTLQFASLKITAREMRGGAIIFLTPIHPTALSS